MSIQTLYWERVQAEHDGQEVGVHRTKFCSAIGQVCGGGGQRGQLIITIWHHHHCPETKTLSDTVFSLVVVHPGLVI